MYALYSFVSVVVSVLDWLLEEEAWLLCSWLDELATELEELASLEELSLLFFTLALARLALLVIMAWLVFIRLSGIILSWLR